MSALAAGVIGAQVLLQPRCVLGLATGSSPIGTYEKLVEAHRAGRLDFSQVRTVNLDEYCGLSGDNPPKLPVLYGEAPVQPGEPPPGEHPSAQRYRPDMEAEARRYEALVESWAMPICSCWALATTATSALTSPATASPRRCTRWS